MLRNLMKKVADWAVYYFSLVRDFFWGQSKEPSRSVSKSVGHSLGGDLSPENGCTDHRPTLLLTPPNEKKTGTLFSEFSTFLDMPIQYRSFDLTELINPLAQSLEVKARRQGDLRSDEDLKAACLEKARSLAIDYLSPGTLEWEDSEQTPSQKLY